MSYSTEFPNVTFGRPFRYVDQGDGEFLTEDGVPILRPGAENAIKANPECAAHFLKLLSSGGLDLSGQEHIAPLLIDLGERCRFGINSAWLDLRPLLDIALGKLASDALAVMSEHGHESVLSDDELSDHFAYGPDVCIRYGLSVARVTAQAGFLSALAKKMLLQPRPQDLCGDWVLEVSEPKDAKFARSFTGIFGGSAHARIVELEPGRRWQMTFLDFPASKPWYGLEGAAYEAAAPLVAQTLGATVRASGTLHD